MEQDNLTNHIASIILQTEGGADCKGQLSIPLVKKIDRSSWGTVRRSIFFVIIAFHLGKLCHDLNGQTDHIHDQAQQRENEREQCESLQQIHSICPGCGSLHLLRALERHSHLAGRGPNSSFLFLPLAAVVAVAERTRRPF